MSELMTDDLAAFAILLREAVHEVSPETRLGYMHASGVTHDVTRIARALAGRMRPFVRPQIPLYREDFPLTDYPERFWNLDLWKARLSKDVELFPECENYPYDPALKSPVAAFAHHAYILSAGEPRVALSLNGSVDGGKVPSSESRTLVDYFAARKGQISTIEQLLQNGGNEIGVTYWQDPESQKLGLARRFPLKALLTRGVPVRCVRQPEEATLLWGDTLQQLDDAHLDKVLQRGGFLDLQALQVLKSRKRLEAVGLSLGKQCTAAEVMHIRYQRQDAGFELWPYYYFVGRLPGKDHLPYYVSASDSTIHVTYLDEQRQSSAPHLVTWTSPSGARFALLNAITDSTTGMSLLSCWSASNLVRAIEWIQGKPIPARTNSEGAFMLKGLRLASGNEVLLTIWNLSTAPAPVAAILLSPELAEWKWSRMNDQGQLASLGITSRNGITSLTLDKSMPSLGCCFLLASRNS